MKLFDEQWDYIVTKLIPKAKYLDSFSLQYRPWLKDKSHTYRIQFAIRDHDNNRKRLEVPDGIPYFIYGYGETKEQAANDFIAKWHKFLRIYVDDNTPSAGFIYTGPTGGGYGSE